MDFPNETLQREVEETMTVKNQQALDRSEWETYWILKGSDNGV
jgi:hypothetical protein